MSKGMRGALALTVAVIGMWAGTAAAQIPQMAVKRISWRPSCLTCVNGVVDSLEKNLGGATDTTGAIDIRDMVWGQPNTGVTGTAAGAIRGFVSTINGSSSIDTLNYEIDSSPDGGTSWFQTQSRASVVIASSTAKVVPFLINVVSNTAYSAYYAHTIRLRVWIVTGTFTAARLHIAYPKNPAFSN